MVKKAEYNRETKTAETKVVTNAARAKRNELTDLERMLARYHFCSDTRTPCQTSRQLHLCAIQKGGLADLRHSFSTLGKASHLGCV